MKGIVLAAGKGSRLNAVAGSDPKCLVRVGGVTLVERQLELLRACGLSELAVVVGCQADRVRRACGPGVQFVENARFAQTNSLYSLWLARPLLRDGFVVMNCDVLAHPALVNRLLKSRHEDAVLVAYRQPDDPPFGDEEMKVEVRRHAVVQMAKTLDERRAHGENVGIAKFGMKGARVLIERMDAIVGAGGVHDWAPRAFSEFAAIRPLHVIATGGLPWIEIDFPDDYERAVREVLPLIETPRERRVLGTPSLAPVPASPLGEVGGH